MECTLFACAVRYLILWLGTFYKRSLNFSFTQHNLLFISYICFWKFYYIFASRCVNQILNEHHWEKKELKPCENSDDREQPVHLCNLVSPLWPHQHSVNPKKYLEQNLVDWLAAGMHRLNSLLFFTCHKHIFPCHGLE